LFEMQGVLLAYLFGSLAQGKDAQGVDLAILPEGQPAYRLRERIVECLNRERLDLVDVRRAFPVLCFEIFRTGYCLYAVSEDVQDRCELETLYSYRDTRPMRRRQQEYLRERIAQWSSAVSGVTPAWRIQVSLSGHNR
jgi:hypothetical protein